MMKLYLTDLVLMTVCIWLLANIIRYFLAREGGGGFFCLSDKWLKKRKN